MGGSLSFPVKTLSNDRIAIVTRGNTGIGYEMAKWLTYMGATVIIACRSEERAKKAIEKIIQEYPSEKEKLVNEGHTVPNVDNLNIVYMNVDLMSFRSVLEFVDEFKQRYSQLHILLCNAGIGMAPLKKTEDGFESILQTNYLSHFLMIAKLLPLMKKSGEDCRIHLVSSLGHKYADFNLATMNYKGTPGNFGRFQYYCRSKLYQIMQTYAMARRLKGSDVNITCSHPGAVDTEFDRSFPDIWYFRLFFSAGRMTGTLLSPIEGAKTALNCVVNPSLSTVSGEYFNKCRIASPSSLARNKQSQEALWKQTLEFLKDHLTENDIKGLEGQT